MSSDHFRALRNCSIRIHIIIYSTQLTKSFPLFFGRLLHFIGCIIAIISFSYSRSVHIFPFQTVSFSASVEFQNNLRSTSVAYLHA